MASLHLHVEMDSENGGIQLTTNRIVLNADEDLVVHFIEIGKWLLIRSQAR